MRRGKAVEASARTDSAEGTGKILASGVGQVVPRSSHSHHTGLSHTLKQYMKLYSIFESIVLLFSCLGVDFSRAEAKIGTKKEGVGWINELISIWDDSHRKCHFQ